MSGTETPMRVVSVEFRDWECMICENVAETHEESAEHQMKEHMRVLQFYFLPSWIREALMWLVVLYPTTFPVKLAGRVWWRLRKGNLGDEYRRSD